MESSNEVRLIGMPVEGINALKEKMDVHAAKAKQFVDKMDLKNDFDAMSKLVQYASRSLVQQAQSSLMQKRNSYSFFELMRDAERSAWGVVIRKEWKGTPDGKGYEVKDVVFGKRKFNHKRVELFDAAGLVTCKVPHIETTRPILYLAFKSWAGTKNAAMMQDGGEVAKRMIVAMEMMEKSYKEREQFLDRSGHTYSSYSRVRGMVDSRLKWNETMDIDITFLPNRSERCLQYAGKAELECDAYGLRIGVDTATKMYSQVIWYTLTNTMPTQEFMILAQLERQIGEALQRLESFLDGQRKDIDETKQQIRQILAKELLMMKVDDVSAATGEVDVS